MSGVMSFKINIGSLPYNVIWKVNLTNSVRHYESSEFCLLKEKWYFALNIDINSCDEEDWRLFLKKVHPDERFNTFMIAVYLEDKRGKLECLNFSRLIISSTSNGQVMWRRKSSVKMKYPDLIMEGHVLMAITMLPDDRYTPDFEYCKEDKRIQSPSYLSLHPCLESLSNDFSKLLQSGVKTDVELQCGEKILKAHRVILISRSKVFSAMLQHDTLEKSRGVVQIIDIEYDILEYFLMYLYSATLPELNVELASNLYEVGDKYAVMSLVHRCRNYLKENLTEENACSILVLAETRSDKALKEFIISFIIRNDIIITLYEEGSFRECHPKLAVDVLFRAYKSLRQI